VFWRNCPFGIFWALVKNMTQRQLFKLPSTSHSVAWASAMAFGAQVLFALLMLKAFTPQDVGQFSVVSQIAFFWMTLSLAQSPLSLLANAHLSAHVALQTAWRESCQRAVWLMPLAVGAWWLSGLSGVSTLGWIALLAFCQMAWGLAQSFVLRTRAAPQQIAVRVTPPLVALMAALLAAAWGANAQSLMASAGLGYAVGATWLWRAWRDTTPTPSTATSTAAAPQSDARSPRLRLAHTLADALMATAVIVVWQRLYGAQETGWMSAVLRVFGFIPAVVHMAWAQVMLTSHGQPSAQRLLALRLGGLAFLLVFGLGGACALALQWGWLDARWQGVADYVWPLALWQGAACVFAAFSHRPFQTNSAASYSLGCIGVVAIQALTLLLPWAGVTLTAQLHLTLYAGVSAVGLGAMAWWMQGLTSNSPKHLSTD
jgi:uncharacterized membrane protein YqaE (UPF0057 family)